mmetsp:Transcript_5744/g.13290  ORF Transcript_5744/g.13290 Transcript_5744/m.13290 type:complete len:117 (+) Transcript_5744:66-416(+)
MADDDEEVARVSTRTIKRVQQRMADNMAARATDIMDVAMDTMIIEKDIARQIKLQMDKEFGGTWNAVVGVNFGCSVTHETKYLIFFSVDHLKALVFCSDQPTGPATDAPAGKKDKD